MKHKITYRLIGYFSAVLLLFSLIAGLLFWALFAWRTAEIHEAELKKRAVSIADTLSQFSQRGQKGRGQSGGYGAYMRFLDEIAMRPFRFVRAAAPCPTANCLRGRRN